MRDCTSPTMKCLWLVLISCLVTSTQQQQAGDLSQLFIANEDAEVVDLAADGPQSSCFVPAPLPEGATASRSVAAFLNGAITVCGGLEDATGCRVYDREGDAWVGVGDGLVQPRIEAAAAFLPDGRLWIAGGGNGVADPEFFLSSTEILDPLTLTSVPSEVDLPFAMQHHSLVRIGDSSRYFLYGAEPSKVAGRTWIYDFDDPESGWVETGRSEGHRLAQVAGYAITTDGQEQILVAGGVEIVEGSDSIRFDDSEIYDVATGEFRPGPTMPAILENSAMVGYGGGLVQAGGYDGENFYDLILFYDPDEESWTEMDQRMVRGRSTHVAVILPEDYFPCS